MAGELMVFTGRAHPELAEHVVDELNMLDSSLNLNLISVGSDFPDNETCVKIPENVRGCDAFLIQPTGPPVNNNYMESFIIGDALRRSSADRLTMVMPYMGYSRQDRKDTSRVPITASLVLDLAETAGFNRFLSIDLHAAQTQGFTNRPFDHLYAAPAIRKRIMQDIEQPVFAAPDVGAAKKARGYAERTGMEWAIVDKDRIDGATTKVAAVIGASVVDRNVVIVDDMATTCGTLVNAASALKERGAASVVAAVTHGVLCGPAIERLENSDSLDRLYVTDTLPESPETAACAKVRRISIAPLLARAIYNIHNDRSVSELF